MVKKTLLKYSVDKKKDGRLRKQHLYTVKDQRKNVTYIYIRKETADKGKKKSEISCSSQRTSK